MCAGAIYWGNVRRVVFAVSQEEIGRITGGNPENMQLAISSREIFARGDHRVQVSGRPALIFWSWRAQCTKASGTSGFHLRGG
jgi:tRNA(Arg) A34 adenosine deaminase TadA